MLKKLNLTRIWVALVASVLLLGVMFVPTGTQALSKENLLKGQLGAVKLLIIDNDLKILGTCSGTHQGNGVILTNWHCVGHTDLYGPDDTGMNLQHGDTYNSDGMVAVAPSTDPRQIPKPTYFAKVVAGNPDIDVAVVKIFRMIDPKVNLPNAIPIPPVSLADSTKVSIGDLVHIFGYPGVGGERITYTTGHISGFEDQTGSGADDSFKTDAAINPGNSGGLAMNDDGDQIGIPTFGSRSDVTGPGLGGIRESNLAAPYVQQVLDLGDVTPVPIPTGTVENVPTPRPQVTSTPNRTPGPNRTPTPNRTPGTPGPSPTTAAGQYFGDILFGTDVQNGKLVGQATEFDSGLQQIVGVFAFQNMRNGMKWGAAWEYNGQIVIDQRNSGSWNAGQKGVNGVSISLEEGLPDGDYRLLLFVNNKQVQQGAFRVGSGGEPTPQPPNPQDKGVVLQGQIVDGDTGDGIANAAMLILKPGVKVEDLTQANLEENTAAAALADQDGFYITAPPIARGQTYSVIVFADGYQGRIFEDGLEITNDDPDVLKMENLPLTKQ